MAHLNIVARPKAIAANQFKAQKFPTAIREWTARLSADMPNLRSATKITAQIFQAVEMDTALIDQAKKRGESWRTVELRFPRKNAKGDPYSRRAILEEVRDVRNAAA